MYVGILLVKPNAEGVILSTLPVGVPPPIGPAPGVTELDAV